MVKTIRLKKRLYILLLLLLLLLLLSTILLASISNIISSLIINEFSSNPNRFHSLLAGGKLSFLISQ